MAGAYAQSLGEASAELWIGRPLEVTIPARFASTDSRDTCVHAEVSYGGNVLAPSQVQTTVLGTDEYRRVRITSNVIVDEPLVTVSLRAGCAGTLTRSYTLLPDMPTDAVLARLLQPASDPVVFRAPAAPVPASVVAARAPSRAAVARAIPVVARAAAAPRPRAASAFRTAAPAPAARLRLEAIEADASALLRVSANLSQPAADSAQRANAAVLWQAISATPEEVMRSTAALQKLETELAYLRLSAGQTRAEMAALRQRLDQPRPWYTWPGALPALALLLLGGAAGAVLLARHSRRAASAPVWYANGGTASEGQLQAQAPGTDATGSEAAQPTLVPASTDADALAQHAARESQPQSEVPAPWASLDVAPPEPGSGQQQGRETPAAPASGLLRVETLAATLEEVDFLSSLGLYTEAMDVLKAYLEDCANPSPVAFFELMRVCSLADDPQAVEAVRRRYAKVAGQLAPRLEQVTAAAGLEAQADLNARVTARWGTPDVLPVIEQALFEVPAIGASLTLQAARDLICLYDVAMLLAAQDQAAAAPAEAVEAGEPALAPWAHAEHACEADAVTQAISDDFGAHRFGVDIDLTVAPQVPPEPPEQPEQHETQRAAARQLADEHSARQAAARAAAEAEDAFSAAVAFERAPVSRF